MPKQARGCRETEATSLRVKHIEDALNFRTDLTMAERRSLRSRKNTANFRERRRQACNQKQFYEVEIDLVIQEVSLSIQSDCLELSDQSLSENLLGKALLQFHVCERHF